MNKEYEPEWGQASGGSQETPGPKQHVPGGLKQIVTIRLDIDMLEWFKSGGPGYQTRINQVLREYMDAQRGSASEQ